MGMKKIIYHAGSFYYNEEGFPENKQWPDYEDVDLAKQSLAKAVKFYDKKSITSVIGVWQEGDTFDIPEGYRVEVHQSSINIYADKGHRVTVGEETIGWGYSHDKEKAKKYLQVGKVYTIYHIEIREWSSDVFLDEIPQQYFNSVHFLELPSAHLVQIPIEKEHVAEEGIFPPEHELAERILNIRDCLVKSDYTEAYHQLIMIADTDLENVNHWEKLESLTRKKQ
jgi:hypothetical protein